MKIEPDLRLKIRKGDSISFCAPDALSFEHFLPWIHKIMLAYQDQEAITSDQMLPQDASFSKTKRYYSKKVN